MANYCFNGGFGQRSERGIQGLWNQIWADVEAEKVIFRLFLNL
jgi:hypothetical protein